MIIRPVIIGIVRPPVRSALSKGGGVPASALTLNGQPITLNGQYITLTKAA